MHGKLGTWGWKLLVAKEEEEEEKLIVKSISNGSKSIWKQKTKNKKTKNKVKHDQGKWIGKRISSNYQFNFCLIENSLLS